MPTSSAPDSAIQLRFHPQRFTNVNFQAIAEEKYAKLSMTVRTKFEGASVAKLCSTQNIAHRTPTSQE